MNKSGKKTFYIFPILLLSAVFLFGCVGCGSQDTSQSTDTSEDVSAEVSEEDVPEEKVVLTLATSESTRLDTEFISEINAEDYPFTIEIVDYQEAADGDETLALTNLNKDLAAGDGPDIIDLSAFEFDLESYTEKGVFVDLYSYLDADADYNRDSIVPAALHSSEFNDTLIGIMSGFTVKTIAASSEIVQEVGTSWNLEDFSEYVSNIGSSFLLSEDVMDADSLLDNLSQTTFQTLVDYTNGTADFENPEFVDLLNAVDQAVFTEENEVKARIVSLGGFMEQQVLEKVMGGAVTYIGFPSLDGEESCSYLNNQENYLAICSTSSEKDLCWEFLRLFLSEEYQNERYIKEVETAFPSNSASLDALKQYSMETLYAEDGTENTERGMYGDGYLPAEQDAVDQILDVIDSVEVSQRSLSVSLSELINEEVTAFLSGTQTVEKTAENLQNRASILVSEAQ